MADMVETCRRERGGPSTEAASPCPKGAMSESPGLRYSRYPGMVHGHGSQPQRGLRRSGPQGPAPRHDDATPLGLDERDGIGTQGSGCTATMGWRTQSPWDRGAARPTPSSRLAQGTSKTGEVDAPPSSPEVRSCRKSRFSWGVPVWFRLRASPVGVMVLFGKERR